jgi:hypothetical protein
VHPELQILDQQYRQIVAALQAGHLSEQDALGILAGMNAVDGEGAVWTIDPYSGNFVRSFPGQTPTPADPSYFIPAQLPTPPMPGFGAGGPLGTGQYPPNGGYSPHVPPSLYPPAPAPVGQRVSSSAGAGAARFGQLLGGVSSTLRGLLAGRGRTVALVVVALVVVVAMFSNRPSDDQETNGQTSPPAQDRDSPSSTFEPAPSSPLDEEPPAPVLPSAEQIQAVLLVLTAGTSEQVSALFEFDVAPGTRSAAASLLGATRAGLSLEAPDSTVARDGLAVLAVRSRNPDGSAARAWTVTLGPVPEGWRIVRVSES